EGGWGGGGEVGEGMVQAGRDVDRHARTAAGRDGERHLFRRRKRRGLQTAAAQLETGPATRPVRLGKCRTQAGYGSAPVCGEGYLIIGGETRKLRLVDAMGRVLQELAHGFRWLGREERGWHTDLVDRDLHALRMVSREPGHGIQVGP